MYPLLKRLVDILASAIALAIILPLLLVIIVALRFTGNGEVFFRQERIGYKNAKFNVIKFATMYAVGAQDKKITINNEMTITRLGGFLRQTKLNELPQLINVLRGDMSFVGPRPLLPESFAEYPPQAQEVIYKVRPGITGLGSVVFRDEEDLVDEARKQDKDIWEFFKEVIFPYKAILEEWYYANRSFLVDFKILLLTAWTLIFPSSQMAFRILKGLPDRPKNLKIEFDKMQRLKENISLVFLLTVSIMPLLSGFIPFWDDVQFLALPSFFIVYMIHSLISGRDRVLRLMPTDLFWLVFILIGFLSYLWAVDESLIWYPAFGWLVLILWLIQFRSMCGNAILFNLIPRLFLFFFLLVSFHHFFALMTGIPLDVSWNNFFGNNINYTSCYIVTLYPFLLFYETRILGIKIFKLLFGIFLLYLLNYTSARGAFIALLVIILYYLWSTNKIKRTLKLSIYPLALIVVAALLYFVVSENPFDSNISPLLYDFVNFDEQGRIYMFDSSFKLFREHIFTGIGMGNWHIEAFKYDLSEVYPFNNITEYVRYRCHNIYGQMFAELGLFGGIAFIVPLFYGLYKGFKNVSSLSFLEKACCASLIAYLVFSMFYVTANFFHYHFSGVQWVAFTSLAILTLKSNTYIDLKRNAAIFLLPIAIIAFAWFSVAAYWNNQYFDAKRTSLVQPKEAINKFGRIYHPKFKTTHNGISLLSMNLSQLYENEGNEDLALEYYEKSLSSGPYDPKVLLEYSRYLLRKKNDVTGAKALAIKLYNIQHNNSLVNMLLAEISYREGIYNEMKRYMDKVYPYRFSSQLNLFNYLLYGTEYLEQICQLTQGQMNQLHSSESFNKLAYSDIKNLFMDLEDNENKFSNNQQNQLLDEIFYKWEVDLLHTLSKEQMIIFLEDRSAVEASIIFTDITSAPSFKSSANELLSELITELMVSRKYFTINQLYHEARGNQDSMMHYFMERIDLNQDINQRLHQLLPSSDYKVYVKDDRASHLNKEFTLLREIYHEEDKDYLAIKDLMADYEYDKLRIKGEGSNNEELTNELMDLECNLYLNLNRVIPLSHDLQDMAKLLSIEFSRCNQ